MNNKHDLQKGIQSIKNVSLSKLEKDSMLEHLAAHAAEYPVLVQPIKNNIFVFLRVRYGSRKSIYAFVFAAVLAIVGGNISYVAEQSLPGDFLYPIKIYVNKPMREVLQVSSKDTSQ